MEASGPNASTQLGTRQVQQAVDGSNTYMLSIALLRQSAVEWYASRPLTRWRILLWSKLSDVVLRGQQQYLYKYGEVLAARLGLIPHHTLYKQLEYTNHAFQQHHRRFGPGRDCHRQVLPTGTKGSIHRCQRKSLPSHNYNHNLTLPTQYDDITVVPAVPAANTLGTYKGLNYTGFAVNQVGVGGAAQLTGVAPHTKPNNIVSGVQQTSTTGQNAGFSIDKTKSKFFDLKSLYYGCSINTSEGAEGAAQQCTINVGPRNRLAVEDTLLTCLTQVRGYRLLNDPNPVASAQFSFNPKVTQLVANPNLAQFDRSFSALQRVEIVQIESQSGEALNVVVLDDVAYNLYT